MSEQTQAWTKEPWRFHDCRYVYGPNGEFVVDARGGLSADTDIERIVACVNACAGVERLEPGIVAEMVEALRLIEGHGKLCLMGPVGTEDFGRGYQHGSNAAYWQMADIAAAILARLDEKQ